MAQPLSTNLFAAGEHGTAIAEAFARADLIIDATAPSSPRVSYLITKRRRAGLARFSIPRVTPPYCWPNPPVAR